MFEKNYKRHSHKFYNAIMSSLNDYMPPSIGHRNSVEGKSLLCNSISTLYLLLKNEVW